MYYESEDIIITEIEDGQYRFLNLFGKPVCVSPNNYEIVNTIN